MEAGVTKSLRNATILGASLTLLGAALGLLGYLPGLEVLGRVQENFIPMAPSTAACFLLQGLILLKLAFSPWKRQLGTLILMVIAALTALFGLLEVPGQLTGLDLNFEDKLVPEAGKLGEIPIARMSALTGAFFFLTGAAVFLLLLRSYSLKDRGAHIAGILGSLAFLGSFVATLAYMIGSPLLYGRGATIPIALTTAIAFLWLTFAIISAAGQNSVPLQFFVGPSTRARLMRAFLPIATITILVESLAALYIPTFFPVSPIFIVSVTVVSAMVISGVIVSRVSGSIGYDIDHVEEALAKFPSENPHPVLRIARNGTMLFTNSAAQPLLDKRDVGQAAPDYWKKLSADITKGGEIKKNIEIEYEGKILSFTAVPVPEGDYVNFYGLDITERKKAEEEREKLLHAVGERVKELNCLYTIAKIAAVPDISLEEICQKTAEIIPPSWQYPEITCARILVHDQEYKTTNFKKTKWLQTADIIEYGNKAGTVEVYYLEESPVLYEGPFLKEERDLIEGIAERLGGWIERQRTRQLGEALNTINEAISSTLEFDQIMQMVVEESSKAIGCDRSVIYIREEDMWVPRHVYGFPRDLIGAQFRDSETPFVALAARTRKPVVSHKAADDEHQKCELMSRYDVDSLLAVTLFAKEGIVGSLIFTYHGTEAVFAEAEGVIVKCCGSAKHS